MADKAKAAAVTKKSSPTKPSRKREEVKEEAKPGDDTRRTREASAEKIGEFFGEARKSSSRQLLQTRTQSDSEGDSEFEDGKERQDVDSEEEDEMELALRKASELDVEEILQKRQRLVAVLQL